MTLPAGVSPAVAAALVPVSNYSAAVLTPRVGTLTERRVIGRSVEGRKIVALRYGPATATQVAVVIGQMHGNETGGIPITNRLRQLGAPAGTAMWIIKTVNPDALVRHQRKNAHGVDINRNSPDLWKGTARAPDYYPGPSAVSEPETRAYVSFLDAVSPDVVLIYHQAANGVDSYHAKNMALVNGLARRMKMSVQSFNCDGECTGTLTGWFNKTHPGTALTVELPASVNAAKVKRWTSAARWAIKTG